MRKFELQRREYFSENINKLVLKRYTKENTVCSNLFELKLVGTFLITSNIVGTINELYHFENEKLQKGDTICSLNYLGVSYFLTADFDLVIVKSYQFNNSIIEWGSPLFLLRKIEYNG